MQDRQYLPWMTEPSDAGFDICRWCDRAIYMPALPCSTRPVDGLMRMRTAPGVGARCQWELSTRRPEMIDVIERIVAETTADA